MKWSWKTSCLTSTSEITTYHWQASSRMTSRNWWTNSLSSRKQWTMTSMRTKHWNRRKPNQWQNSEMCGYWADTGSCAETVHRRMTWRFWWMEKSQTLSSLIRHIMSTTETRQRCSMSTSLPKDTATSITSRTIIWTTRVSIRSYWQPTRVPMNLWEPGQQSMYSTQRVPGTYSDRHSLTQDWNSPSA